LGIFAGTDFAFVVSESAPRSSALEEEAALTTSEEFTGGSTKSRLLRHYEHP